MDKGYWYTYRCRRCGNVVPLQLELISVLHCPICDKIELVRDKTFAPIKIGASDPVRKEPEPESTAKLAEAHGFRFAANGKLEKPVCTGGGVPAPAGKAAKKGKGRGGKRGKRAVAHVCPYCKRGFSGAAWFEKHLKTCPKNPKNQVTIPPPVTPTEREIREANKEMSGR